MAWTLEEGLLSDSMRGVTWPDPGLFDDAKRFEWVAKSIAKRLSWGRHQSKWLASGIEFDQYRHYVPGDDLRLLDWKKYARTGRYYMRQSEQEKAHSLSIHLDDSPSMAYAEAQISKLDYAKLLAAVLTYITASQSDHFGWYGANDTGCQGRSLGSWHASIRVLQVHQTYSISKKATPKMIGSMSGACIWMTDLYMDIPDMEKYLSHLRGSYREVLVIHFMGRNEESLDFADSLRFRDLETGEVVVAQSSVIAESYRRALGSHLLSVQELCRRYSTEVHRVYLDDNPVDFLRRILTRR